MAALGQVKGVGDDGDVVGVVEGGQLLFQVVPTEGNGLLQLLRSKHTPVVYSHHLVSMVQTHLHSLVSMVQTPTYRSLTSTCFYGPNTHPPFTHIILFSWSKHPPTVHSHYLVSSHTFHKVSSTYENALSNEMKPM